MENSITKLRKWNLIAGGSDPSNDVIPASVGYGLEEGLQFAVSEITRLEERIKRLEEAGDVLAQRSAQLGLLPMAIEGWRKAKEAKP
jgi:hypothetical protein